MLLSVLHVCGSKSLSQTSWLQNDSASEVIKHSCCLIGQGGSHLLVLVFLFILSPFQTLTIIIELQSM